MSEAAHTTGALDLVLDIGKTRSKLLVLDRQGATLEAMDHASSSLHGCSYTALDTAATGAWLEQAMVDLGPLRKQLTRAIVTAHGAAFALVGEQGLVLPVPDYEFEGFKQRPADWATQIGSFCDTLSPDLPLGLNGATQLDWLERHHPNAFARGQLLPYAQYWSWWLSGAAASEVTSLGCHTHLWHPHQGAFSTLARQRGWAQRFAPVRRAWEVLGTVKPSIARHLGLPTNMLVHVGAHDSNACLARYLRASPRMTLVTTGTWIVVMAPGAPERRLDAQRDLLANVSVRQQAVPTGRFMGGRELLHLCAGADPAEAHLDELARLLAKGVMALPGFERQGGPFRNQLGQVLDAEGEIALDQLNPVERATLAALYAAQVTAWIIDRLAGTGPVVVEGPFSHNPVYTTVLASLLPHASVQVSTDPLEGTARGAWQLAHWTEPAPSAPLTRRVEGLASGSQAALQMLHARWLTKLDGASLASPVA